MTDPVQVEALLLTDDRYMAGKGVGQMRWKKQTDTDCREQPNMEITGKKRRWAAEILFLLLVFAAILCFAAVQPFGDPPDEINRFKVVQYIRAHGSLPRGDDPEILLDGYGASYAFQPILTYIIQGFLLRFLDGFHLEWEALLLGARMVNVLFGVLTAWVVRKIAREVWEEPGPQWTFSVMVMFLPQHLFLHSYVNTDSMALLSVAILFYVLLRAGRTGYGWKECLWMAVGIILCAMSYYNAYGMILAAMLVFVLDFVEIGGEAADSGKDPGVKPGSRKIRIAWKPLLQKGGVISVLVLAGIGWWFLRNGILYQGDLLALEARKQCAMLTATEEFHPLTRFTYQSAGKSLGEMLIGTGYLILLRDSFIAMFGPMQIPTHGLIYLGYQWMWIGTGLAALLPIGKKVDRNPDIRKQRQIVFHGSMLLFCLITIGLSIYYSYSWEYQPQGRYIMPVLIPLMYLVTHGVRKLSGWFGRWIYAAVTGYVLLAFGYSLLDRFLPFYA